MTQEKEFTGRHALAVFVGAFGVIIAVNIALAVSAVKTFPGLEVKNSYIASQSFDDRRAAQEALGWTVTADANAGGVRINITDTAGLPAEIAGINAEIGRSTHVRQDQKLALRFDGTAFLADAQLGPGYWTLRINARATDGTAFQHRLTLRVEGS